MLGAGTGFWKGGAGDGDVILHLLYGFLWVPFPLPTPQQIHLVGICGFFWRPDLPHTDQNAVAMASDSI